ncbi:baseplate J/gp47 family protein [Paraburkholderia susongensis]|uniref:Uncharacterized phage protein gp47/JayE n=1 Tax=Paraburkholderia susongensis TaxID=1515439 RepID=A0A1X7I5V8_9BURK|nr:baseplate J/gp47 family protein [Paraburkholderia susongensis]SMG09249.1 Uncharacterized phage protein gp47/JayE [Paraburkholderia susongensis]
MPYDVPTLPELIRRVSTDLTGRAGTVLRRSDAQVLSRTHGGATHGAYGYQQWIARQIFPDTCDEDMLLRHARLRLEGGRKAAVAASGKVTLSGSAYGFVDEEQLVQTTDSDRRQYVTTGSATLDERGAGEVTLRAVETGAAGNLDAGTELTFVSPVPNVDDTVTVGTDGITGGAEIEPIERLRERVIRAWRRVPAGGGADDYDDWALEVSGVTRAWARRRWLGPGTVGLFFVRDDDENPIPDAAAIEAVREHVERKRPLGAELYVMAPRAREMVYRVHLVPDTGAIRTGVSEALEDFTLRQTWPGGTLIRTKAGAAISAVTGNEDYVLYAPAANIETEGNELVIFGGVEFV